MKYDVLNRFTNNVQFVAEIDCAEDAPESIKLGLAVKLAIKAVADLACANLARANLTGAYLARADLTGADLTGAYLARADLVGADSIIDAGCPNGWRCVGWLKDGVIQLRVGCRDKSLVEGRTYWAGKEDRREIMAALDYIEAVARLRGWPVAEQQAAA